MKNGDPVLVYWLGDSLYLNITNQCSNHCWFCFRNFKQGVSGFNLKLKTEPDASTVIAALKEALLKRRWTEAVFCGFGEPTSRLEVLLEVSRWMKLNYIKFPIRLDTNGHGYALNNGRDVAKELRIAGVGSVSVSLNGHDEQTYAENCRPSFAGAFHAVMGFIKKTKCELPVEITAVRMPEVDNAKVKAIAENIGVPFRIRDYIPCFC